MLYTALTFIFGESQTLKPQLGGGHECMHAWWNKQTTKLDHNTPLSLIYGQLISFRIECWSIQSHKME